MYSREDESQNEENEAVMVGAFIVLIFQVRGVLLTFSSSCEVSPH